MSYSNLINRITHQLCTGYYLFQQTVPFNPDGTTVTDIKPTEDVKELLKALKDAVFVCEGYSKLITNNHELIEMLFKELGYPKAD